MDELKPCSLEAARKWVEQEIHDYCTDGMLIGPEIEAVAALTCIRNELNRRADPENKPLTLDELRQMDREPVWIAILDGSEPIKCEIISEICAEGIKLVSTDDPHDYGSFDLYGKTWLAYARKPEGSIP